MGVEGVKKTAPPIKNIGFTMNSLKNLESSKTVKLSNFAQNAKDESESILPKD